MPMHPHLLSRACALYHTSPELLTPLSGGYSNAVYQFPPAQSSHVEKTRGASPYASYGVLRIGVEDCPPSQTLSMLEFMHYLSCEGAPVVAPRLSVNGRLLERLEFEGQFYNLTAFEKADGTLAENIPQAQWADGLFCSIGSAVGRLHRISSGYHPTRVDFTRPHWFETAEVDAATTQLPTKDPTAAGKLACLIDELKRLPMGVGDYGLIHGDLHFANFLVREGGQVAVIDFDDCGYGWFAMDVAMALFDVLVLYDANDETEKQRFARRFLTCYLSGYRRERNLSSYWLSKLPAFIKLIELCIYATLVGHLDITLPDTWVGRFMRGRSERISNDIPYVDICFSDL